MRINNNETEEEQEKEEEEEEEEEDGIYHYTKLESNAFLNVKVHANVKVF